MELPVEAKSAQIDEHVTIEERAEPDLGTFVGIEETTDSGAAVPAEGLESHLAKYREGGNEKLCPVIGKMDAVAVSALIIAVQQRAEKAKQFSGVSGAEIAARAKARRQQSRNIQNRALHPPWTKMRSHQ